MFYSNVEDKQYQGIAGMMAAFFLILGIFVGVLLSFPLTAIILKAGGAPSDVIHVTSLVNYNVSSYDSFVTTTSHFLTKLASANFTSYRP